MIDKILKSEYWRAAKTIAFTLVLLVAVDQALGHFLQKIYFSQKRGYTYRVTKSLEQIDSDIVIVGSSCAALDFDAKLMSDTLKSSVYNTGRPETRIPYHLAIIRSVLARSTPKLIVLNVDATPFSRPPGMAGTNALIPYYHRHPEIQSIVSSFDKFTPIKSLSMLYLFNEQFPMSFWRLSSKSSAEDLTGFTPVSGKTWTDTMVVYNGKAAAYIDTAMLNYYSEAIAECARKGVPLVLASAPCYARFPDGNQGFDVAKKMAISRNVPFFDHLSDTTFINHPELFVDPFHLNLQGARMFTEKLNAEIRELGIVASNRSGL